MAGRIPYLDESADASTVLASAEILYTDLDGTLLGLGGTLLVDGEGAPSATAAQAVVALNTAGLVCVITSGRNRAQSTEIARVLGWRSFIAELGCVVVEDRGAEPRYDIGDWGHDALLPGETPYEAITRVGALDALRAHFPGRIEEHDPYHLGREATHVLRGNVEVASAQAVLSSLELPVTVVDNGVIRPPRTTLRDVDEVHAYHLVPAGVTKQGAVARDLARRGIARERAIAIGDSAIDVGMAETCALMVLPSNALDDQRALDAVADRRNVVATRGARGDGWAELARAWLAHRAVR